MPRGRFVRFEAYKPGMRYSLGFDTALGIAGKDRDAAVLLDCNRVQVAALDGHFGETFADPLMKVIDAYGGPSNVFIVGERATLGLVILRKLWDSGYTWMYRDHADEKPGNNVRDVLGHVPTEYDITVASLQEAIANQSIWIRDEPTYAECCKFGFQPRTKSMSHDEAMVSRDFKMGAPAGEHDDRVRALALANFGVKELPRFTPPKVELPAGSIGRLLGWDKTANGEDEPKKGRWG